MALVAKSTIAPGQNNMISKIKAPALTCLAGCPSAGRVRWHSLTGPQNNVAHELKEAAINTIATVFKTDFFIELFVFLLPYSSGFSVTPRFIIVSGLNLSFDLSM